MKKLNIFCGIMAIIFCCLGAAYVVYNKKNEDKIAPEIHIDSEQIEYTIDATEAELKTGLTATDNKDGDLTEHILISDIHIDTESDVKNQFDISYLVFDSSSNKTAATRKLIYTDYHSPRFKLQHELRFDSISAVDLYSILNAEDCIDGDISNQIFIEMGNQYLNAISYGTYDCTVQVTNSFGDTAVLPLTFEIYDSTSTEESQKPKIKLSEYLTYIECGDKVNPKSFLEEIVIDDFTYTIVDDSELTEGIVIPQDYGYRNENYSHFLPKSAIEIKNHVDVNTPGLYKVEYSYKQPDSGIKGKTELLVSVE